MLVLFKVGVLIDRSSRFIQSSPLSPDLVSADNTSHSHLIDASHNTVGVGRADFRRPRLTFASYS